jgi:hypothetical protein
VDFKLSRLGRPEMAGMLAAVVLVLSTFLPWFTTDPENKNSKIQGEGCAVGGDCVFNAWQSFDFLQFALIVCAIPPFVLAWIAARDHEVGWLRGELTAIFGFLAFLLVLLNTIILGQPGTVEIGLSWGILVAMAASLGIMFAGAMRQYSYQQPEPPGV